MQLRCHSSLLISAGNIRQFVVYLIYLANATAFICYFSSKNQCSDYIFKFDRWSLLTDNVYDLSFTIDCGLTYVWQLLEMQYLTY